MPQATVPIHELYALRPRALWAAFKADGFAFWMSCAYLFFEYVRPQAIWQLLSVYPYWARTFLALALLGWLLDAKRKIVWTKITVGVLALLLVIILSSAFAYWPEYSWAEFITYFNWVVVFLVLTHTITTRKRIFVLLLLFMLASFKLSQHGARTWAMRGFAFEDWGVQGPQGYFQNSGEFAIQMLIFAPISLYFLLALRPMLARWQVALLSLLPITATLTILATNTRGGQLALLAQIIAVIFVSRHRFKAFVLIAIIAAVGFQLLPEEQRARFESMGQDDTSRQRLLYWEHGWQMMQDHPVLGVGYFNFIPYYAEHHREDLILPGAIRQGYGELPHNILIQVGTDAGFTGLAIFMLLIYWGFTSMRHLHREATARGDVFFAHMGQAMNLALLGYVVAGQFVTVAYYPFLWIHLTLCVAFQQIQKSEQPKPARRVEDSERYRGHITRPSPSP